MPEAQSGPDERVTVRLTVAAVAERLGVAASTLRTWERRYGLGPSMRTAGRHRRYSAEDVDRLEAMRRLTRDGVAPADAARVARGLDPDSDAVPELTAGHADEVLDPLSMAAAAVEADEQRLHRMIARAVRQSEGLSVWQNLVRPALDLLEARDHGDQPGRDPVSVLGAALLAALRSVAPDSGADAPVIIHADHDHHLDAHVLATELAVHGVQARVLRPARRRRDADSAGSAAAHVRLAVLLGNPHDASAVVQTMRESGRTAFVISLTGVPQEFADLPRARTLAGAVHEIADLLSERPVPDAAGARR
ncbi:MerR family transcriptional regulator [Ruania suaedae]|uniref:MerR family transcriptional regulator n=1 Tax=Ruania suaedae TaxID=2897774 RepID=UPI001E43BBCD|nr:MerR family transcriptional regulator [Ruania suaedae]UFU02348.1 MerR family transcriptional regulator [Ruania suaedae]